MKMSRVSDKHKELMDEKVESSESGDSEEDEDEGDGENGEAEERPISEAAKARARRVFERAHKSMKEKELKEERVTLLNAWLSFERAHGSTPDDVAAVEKQMPRRVKRRRRLEDDSFEEYVDYVFPADDEQKQDQLKMLAMAQAWKQSGGAMSG